MKTIYFILIALLLSVGCSKQKMTTSKIKISGGNILNGTLSTRASNGLIIYGKSTDGKSFLKKIDNNTVDMEFPNGTWNFYSIAWENASATSAFQGTVHCGKTENVNLTGTDVSIDLNLSNASCNDGAFASARSTGTFVTFPGQDFVSCKDVSTITGYSEVGKCDISLNNRGYATYIKFYIPQYKKFNGTVEEFNSSFQSACIKMGDNTSINYPNGTVPGGMISVGSLNLPDSINGIQKMVKVYYSSNDANGCDDSSTPDEFVLSQDPTPRTRIFNYVSGSIVYSRTYFQANESQICQGTRLAVNPSFGGGFGSVNAPSVICNKDQLQSIAGSWSINKNKSFELGANLDMGMVPFMPIGDDPSVLSNSASFTGTFYGNNKRIENLMISCSDLTNDSTLSEVGLFRRADGSMFSDLTINRLVINCEKTNDNVGGVVGTVNNSSFKNIKVFGHINGGVRVGMIVGSINLASTYGFSGTQLHTYGGIEGKNSIGGIFGGLSSSSSAFGILSEVSTFMQMHASDNTSNASNSWLGGIGGYSYVYNSGLNVSKAVVKIKSMEGDMFMGGLFGETAKTNIYDSYVTGLIIQSHYTDGSTNKTKTGGLIGQSTDSETISNSLAIVQKISNKNTSDYTLGGIVGNMISTPTCSNTFYNGEYDVGNISGCNNNSSNLKTIPQLVLSSTYSSYSTSIWEQPDVNYDIPRLKFEASIESQIPYLKRECSGLYTTPSGSGTSADPFSICSVGQLTAMTSGPYYKLKRNLLLGGADLSANMLVPGVYHLDGDNHAIIGMSLLLNNNTSFGLFKELQSGSYIKNLNIVGSSLSGNNTTISSGNQNIGLLAGINSGTIENVNILQSSFEVRNYNQTSTSYSSFGGVVGQNTSTGIIKNSKHNFKMSLFSPQVNAGGLLYYGGLVGKNLGTVSGIRFNGEVNRNIGNNIQSDSATAPFTCDTSHVGWYYYNTSTTSYFNCNGSSFIQVYPISSREYFGGLAGLNASGATVKEIEYDGSFSISDYNTNSSGTMGPVAGISDGTINDLLLKISVNNSRLPIGSLIGSGTSSVLRSILNFRSYSGFSPSTSPFPSGSAGSLCLATSMPGCYNSSVARLEYEPAGNLLTFFNSTTEIPGLIDLNNWSVATEFFNRGTSAWLIEGDLVGGVITKSLNNDLPRLSKTEGSFEELGVGF